MSYYLQLLSLCSQPPSHLETLPTGSLRSPSQRNSAKDRVSASPNNNSGLEKYYSII